MRNSVDLGVGVRPILSVNLEAIMANKMDEWLRSKDITAKKNAGKQIIYQKLPIFKQV